MNKRLFFTACNHSERSRFNQNLMKTFRSEYERFQSYHSKSSISSRGEYIFKLKTIKIRYMY